MEHQLVAIFYYEQMEHQLSTKLQSGGDHRTEKSWLTAEQKIEYIIGGLNLTFDP